jgi:regulator of sigma E protease
MLLVQFILAFGFLVFIHEFGHFVAAKLQHIEVEEFGFGFPPKLFKLFTWKGTDFTLNAIPFGGFCRIVGETDTDAPGGMSNASIWTRFSILAAGPMMNLIAGILFFTITIARVGTPDPSIVIVSSVTAGSPAAAAGLQANDILRKVNDTIIDSSETMQNVVAEAEGNPIEITYERDAELGVTSMTPAYNEEYQRHLIGIVMSNPHEKLPFFQAIPAALQMTYEQGTMIFKLPGMLSRGEISKEEARLVGPISMGRLFLDAREKDIETQAAQAETIPNQPTTELPAINTILLMGILSIALAIGNLLPFPALDGGRILLLLPEIITRKRVPLEFENALNAIGFAILIGLMVFVTAQDVINPIVIP